MFWLDFLAIKSGNGAWLLQITDSKLSIPASAALSALPGITYSKALAMRIEEEGSKSEVSDHE
jgi:hypothetical protein